MTARGQSRVPQDERLKAFLKVRPAGATLLQLIVETTMGNVQIAEWPREDAEKEPDELADRILAAAQEHCDEAAEAEKFLTRWVGASQRVIKATTLRLLPAIGASDSASGPASTSHVTDAGIIRELLQTIDKQNRHLMGAVGTITRAYDETIRMLSAELQASYQRRDALPQFAELTHEQREEHLQRAKALEAFTGKLPDLLDLGVAALSNKLLSSGNGKAHEDAGDVD